jgi:hypothetical protein
LLPVIRELMPHLLAPGPGLVPAIFQTSGKLLADRSLSRLLKDDWPRRIEEWEEKR